MLCKKIKIIIENTMIISQKLLSLQSKKKQYGLE